MIVSDFHMHSHFSSDSTAPIWQMCLSAQKHGLSEICLTDHVDLNYIPGKEHWFMCDVPRHKRALERIRAGFPSLKIRRGLELADMDFQRERLRRYVTEDQLDFVLLSRHVVQGVDPYNGLLYYQGYTREENYRRYLEAVWDSVRYTEDFDALAHIGYVTTYSPYTGADKPLKMSDAPDILDAIFRSLIERGKALEVNTGKWEITGQTVPSFELLRRYKELGGELVSIGSDAHRPEVVAWRFRETEQALLQIGLTHVATFCQRKMRVYTLG